MKFSERIKKMRLGSKLKQPECAALLEISERTLRDWETGRSKPKKIMQSAVVELLKGVRK